MKTNAVVYGFDRNNKLVTKCDVPDMTAEEIEFMQDYDYALGFTKAADDSVSRILIEWSFVKDESSIRSDIHQLPLEPA